MSEQTACDAGRRSEHKTLDKKLANQSSTAGPQGGADSNLPFADGCPGEQQVADVAAGDQEQQEDSSKQGVKRVLKIADHEVQERACNHLKLLWIKLPGICLREAMHNRIEIRGGRLQADTLFQTRQRPDNRGVLHRERSAIGAGTQTKGKPKAGTVSVKALRHDADERPRLAVQKKISAENLGIAMELRLPQAIVHHEHQRRTGPAVFGRENAAKDRRNSQKVKTIRGGVATKETAGALSVRVKDIQLIVSHDVFEDVVLLANGEELRDGVVVAPAFVSRARQISHLKDDGTLEIAIRDGIEDDIIYDAEHYGGRANPESERENSDQREAAILGQAAQGVLKIAKKILNVVFCARLAAVLLDL